MTLRLFQNRAKARGCRSAGFVIFLFFAAASQAFAVSPAVYRASLGSAHLHVDQLLETVAKAETGNRDVQRESYLIAQIRREIPETEKVEWPGGSVETANGWLFAELDAFQQEEDSTKRAVILTAINERLASITEKIEELQNPAVSEPTKDQDKQKLAEILRREEYQKPQVKEESMFQKWLREFMDWLARVFPSPAISPGTASGAGSLQFVLQILIYAVVIGLIGFLIYRFAPLLSRRFGGKTGRKKQDRVILGERIGMDELASDLFSEAELLAREGNLRAAIRKGYIALLCDLSDRKIIGLARHKTNRDYLRDVRRNARLFENMTGLTGNFERNWYGLRAAELADWEEFRTRYQQTIADVKS